MARPIGPQRTFAHRVNVCGMASVTVRVIPHPGVLCPLPAPAPQPPVAATRPAMPGRPARPAKPALANAPESTPGLPKPCPRELEPGRVMPRQVCRRLGADSELGIVREKVDAELDSASGGTGSASTEAEVGDSPQPAPPTAPLIAPVAP